MTHNQDCKDIITASTEPDQPSTDTNTSPPDDRPKLQSKPPKKRKLSKNRKTSVIIQPDSPDLQIAISERGKNLKKVIDHAMSRVNARVRAQIVITLEGLADGIHFLDVTGISGLTMPVINSYIRHYPIFRDLYHAARASGDEMRRAKREYIAHDHAVNGTDRPVYQQGVQVGIVREYDHRLLEFLLKADNPVKYRDSAAAVNINNQTQTIVTWDFSNCGPENRDSAPPEAK